MRFGLLGPLVITHDAGSAVDIGGPRPRLMTAMLVAAAGRVVSMDAIAAELWGDEPTPSAVGTIQSYVSRLRREFESGGERPALPRLIHEPPGYRLRVEDGEADFLRFEELADAAHRILPDDPAEAHRLLVEALALWRGEALGGYADREWFRGLAVRLEDRRLAAIDDRIAADLALGRHAAIVGELAELVAANPFREGFVAHLATALYRTGRQADALRAIADARDALRDELGLDPGPHLRALEQAILGHDETLQAPSPPAPAMSTAPVADRPPQPAAAAPAIGPPIVGRTAELRTLLDQLDAATTRVALIEGEPGIGKTRLAEEIGRIAAGRGAMVLWGRAHEGGVSPAFWPWLPPLRTLTAAHDAPAVAPELATLLAPAAEPAANGWHGLGEASRFALADAIVTVLADRARRQPVVLVLDDVQWADEASLDLLTTVAGRSTGVPLLIVATLRDPDVDGGVALGETLAKLTRLPGTVRIGLRGLETSETARLVEQFTGRAADVATVQTIQRRAEGNPFFTGELARLLASGVAGSDIPSGVRDVVRRRVAMLPSATGELLRVAAVIGRDVDIAQLATAAGRDLEACLDDLEPALTQRLLLPEPDAPGGYRFAHALVREVLVSDVPPLRLARLHLRIADALDASDDNAEIVAEHLWRAVPIGTGRRAAEALERAGLVALRRWAYRSAEDLFARAASLLRPQASGHDADAELRVLMLHVGVLIATQGYPALLGQRSLRRAEELALARGADDDLARLLFAEWAAADLACRYREADAVAEDLLRRTSAADPPRQRVLASTAYGISRWHRGRITEAAHHLAMGRAAADEIPIDARSGVLYDRDQTRLSTVFDIYARDLTGALDGAAAEAEYAAVIAAIPGDRYWELIVSTFAASSALTCGDADRALRATRRGIVVDPDAISGFWSTSLRCFHGAALALTGEVDAGLELLDASWATYQDAGMQTNGVTFLSVRARALAAAGRVADAESAVDVARRQLAATDERFAEPTLLTAEAFLAHATGDRDRAAERFAAATALATEQGSRAVADDVRRLARELGVDGAPVG